MRGALALLCVASACGCARADTQSIASTQAPGKEIAMTNTFNISEQGRKTLLKMARDSIEYYLKNGSMKDFACTNAELTQPAAVFVTLTQKKQLRGCIGTTVAREPLYLAVAELAVSSAVHDGRFRPLTVEELPKTHIEISVLSPLSAVASAAEITPKIHGVVVKRGGRSGLFLPQVWEHFSSKDEFLNELCWQKAGLEPDAWKDPKTQLFIFTVVAFEEP
jgi:AmmeMemoRadiSam system protein A